jgi:small subunit ribosomal protein S6
MRLYETIFIARQDMAPSQVNTLTDRFVSILKDQGGQVSKIEYCGLRALAYPIKKNRKGHYVLLNIVANGDGLKEVERNMRLSEDVLRFLSVKVESHEDGPSALLKSSRHSSREQGDRSENDESMDENHQDEPSAE